MHEPETCKTCSSNQIFEGDIYMSRYTGPSSKQSRRLGVSLTGTGKEIARRNYVPGQHGPNNRSKLSEYGLQLAEKQKLRFKNRAEKQA